MIALRMIDSKNVVVEVQRRHLWMVNFIGDWDTLICAGVNEVGVIWTIACPELSIAMYRLRSSRFRRRRKRIFHVYAARAFPACPRINANDIRHHSLTIGLDFCLGMFLAS
ncbi:hypothetical protein DWU98_16580 [Dyella monticola]|uniref:Uncharacterized protein n=1 Tax=Dyella monticola TaxID=1927958 RepID=A0A370WUE9_9GAMM|nr:hypothetical protein DWU98_16580 [Dyella monticola]